MEFKIFNKWDAKDISINDPGLRDYINLEPRIVPVSFGKYGNKRFGKTKYNLIERFANDLMVSGHIRDTRVHKRVSGRDSGKKQKNLKAIRDALEIIEKKTKQNPLQVLIKAVENSAPVEETTRIRQGGIIVHKSVDVSPERRLDLAIRFIVHGAAQKCFAKKYKISNALADEIIAAFNKDLKTYSISKKEELERIAKSAR